MVVYATSETSDENRNISDGIVEVTVANVPEDTPRLIATTLAAYVFFGCKYVLTCFGLQIFAHISHYPADFMYLLLVEELPWFIEMRHKFLQRTQPRNYTIFVRSIPECYRNSRALEDFMATCFSQETISEAVVPVTANQLSKLQSNRDAALSKVSSSCVPLSPIFYVASDSSH